jgi:hypothetical protein
LQVRFTLPLYFQQLSRFTICGGVKQGMDAEFPGFKP